MLNTKKLFAAVGVDKDTAEIVKENNQTYVSSIAQTRGKLFPYEQDSEKDFLVATKRILNTMMKNIATEISMIDRHLRTYHGAK
jgi:hypothetical protein